MTNLYKFTKVIPVTIVFDLDGVICEEVDRGNFIEEITTGNLKLAKQHYAEQYKKATPIKEAIRLIQELHAKGHMIIIHTSRWSDDEEITLNWLKENEVPFNKLVMDKPWGHYYVDDKFVSLRKLALEFKVPIIHTEEEST